MANETLSLNTDTIHHHVRQAVGELYSGAENMRLVATALEDVVGALNLNAGPEGLRHAAAVVKTHTAGLLARAASLSNKAERLETIADIRSAAEPPFDEV